MISRGDLKLNQKGFTFIEIMISVTILAIVTPVLFYLFSKASQGFAADEMHTLLKKNNQETLNHIHVRLTSCKRMFQNDGVGPAFLGLVNLTGAPVTFPGSKLPLAQTGSLSPGAGALQANFGNSLFFAVYDSTQTILNSGATTLSTYPAPATLLNVVDSGGVTHKLIIDLYRFYYYYLTPANPHGFNGVPSYALVEWESAQYPDFQQLNDLYSSDVTLGSNAASLMAASGLATVFNVAQTVAANAFSLIVNSGGVTAWSFAALGTPQIGLGPPWKSLTSIQGGVLSRGFRYGISPNSAGWNEAPVKVPQFAAAAGNFPGGFEIGLAGTSAGRSVLIRSVLTAKGAAPKVEFNDYVMTTNARDVW